MSNGPMQHQNPDLDFDDTRIILQGASCIIAASSYGGRSRGGGDARDGVLLTYVIRYPHLLHSMVNYPLPPVFGVLYTLLRSTMAK
jgi:hypothetical protein